MRSTLPLFQGAILAPIPSSSVFDGVTADGVQAMACLTAVQPTTVSVGINSSQLGRFDEILGAQVPNESVITIARIGCQFPAAWCTEQVVQASTGVFDGGTADKRLCGDKFVSVKPFRRDSLG